MTYHHGNLEEALIAAARDELAETGPDALSLRGVARRAGVSHAAPYHHFDGKAGLLARVAEQGFRGLDAAMAAAQQAAAADAQAQLVATGTGYMNFALGSPAVFKLMFRGEFLDDYDDPALREASSTSFGRLLAAVEAVHRDAGLEQADAMADAVLAWSAVHGLATLAVEGALGWLGADVDELADVVARRLAPLFATEPADSVIG